MYKIPVCRVIGGNRVLRVGHSETTLHIRTTHCETDEEEEQGEPQGKNHKDKVNQLDWFEFERNVHLGVTFASCLLCLLRSF